MLTPMASQAAAPAKRTAPWPNRAAAGGDEVTTGHARDRGGQEQRRKPQLNISRARDHAPHIGGMRVRPYAAATGYGRARSARLCFTRWPASRRR